MASRTGRSRLTLVILVLVTVTLVTLDVRNVGPFERVKSAAEAALDPVVSGARRAGGPLGDAWDSVTGYDDLKRENERLRTELEIERGRDLANANATVVLQEYLAQAQIQYVTDIPSTAARVVRQLGNFPGFTVDVDKGSSAGVKVGMPAVTSAGLVGRVVDVAPGRSRIRLISDPEFELGVRLVGGEAVAIARGTGRGQPLVVSEGIDITTPVAVGMLMTTSGIDRSVYPPDIPVGLVAEVEVDPGLNQVLSVQPAASLESLTFVTILLYDNAL
ncbi:MAG: rod shape-determining protein MreC [Acidimicrobiia bacterium]|nr:rod shape-determining protein MreC [Acidimicrobiia bacterium]